MPIQPLIPFNTMINSKSAAKLEGGTFTLSFRGKTTVAIDYNADVTTITAALEALPTLGVGHVSVLLTGSQACTESGSASTSFTVEFLQDFGSLPLMVPDDSNLFNENAISGDPSLSVSKQIDGTKEDAQCSNRGLCDTTTGYCTCNTNYDTSNGYAESGTRGDCGYATATIAVCPGLFRAVAMVNVQSPRPTSARVQTDGPVVTAASAHAPLMWLGLLCPLLTMKHT